MQILGGTRQEAERLISNFYDGNPGLKKLIDYLQKYYAKHNHIKALDQREIYVKSAHTLLNRLIQTNAAIIFKSWSVNVWKEIDKNNWDAEIIIMYHDELQSRVHENIIGDYQLMLGNTLTNVEKEYSIQVPLATDSKVGMNWRDTH